MPVAASRTHTPKRDLEVCAENQAHSRPGMCKHPSRVGGSQLVRPSGFFWVVKRVRRKYFCSALGVCRRMSDRLWLCSQRQRRSAGCCIKMLSDGLVWFWIGPRLQYTTHFLFGGIFSFASSFVSGRTHCCKGASLKAAFVCSCKPVSLKSPSRTKRQPQGAWDFVSNSQSTRDVGNSIVGPSPALLSGPSSAKLFLFVPCCRFDGAVCWLNAHCLFGRALGICTQGKAERKWALH